MKDNKKRLNRIRRKKRVRSKVFGTGSRPRLTVFRSNQHIYAQIINDEKGETLVSASDFDLRSKTVPADSLAKKKKTANPDKAASASKLHEKYSKSAKAEKVGDELAKKADKKKIKQVVFDKSGYRYHGAVKALAEAVRKGGIDF